MWLILYGLSSLAYILIPHTPLSSRPTYYRARAALIYNKEYQLRSQVRLRCDGS